ncbi:MAG: molecular chaperone [Acidobacteriota bacterium]
MNSPLLRRSGGPADRAPLRTGFPRRRSWSLLLVRSLGAVLLAGSPAGAQTPAEAPSPAPKSVEASAPADVPGIGDLLVAPTRIVFEGRTRAAELTLLNIGKQTATYRISFTHLRMGETGDLKEIDKAEPGDRFADDLVRYSPRQVTLDPNVAQTIRLQVRKPEGLADGEYRSHLLFRAVPPESSQPETSVEAPEKKTGYSIRLTPIYGVSIPVIVRSGAVSVKVTLSDLEVRPPENPGDPMSLDMKIRRDGNESVYGNLRVTFVPLSGKEQVVAVLNGVAVYTPNTQRLLRFPLQPPPGLALAKGRLKVSYVRAEQNGDVLAAAETALP